MNALDLDRIRTLGGLEKPEIQEVIIYFLDDLEPQAAVLAGHLEKGDREAFRAGVHRLKGAGLMSGCAGVASLAMGWELHCDTGGPLPDPAELKTRLAAAARETRAALEQALSGA